MRILVLVHEFPPVGGGGGRVAQEIACGLARRGHELHLLTTHLEGLPLAETIDGVQVRRLPTHPRRETAFRATLPEMAAYNLAAIRAGRDLIAKHRIDLIHAHFAVPAGAAAYALSRLTGVPYILTAHLGDVPGAVPEKTDRWFRWLSPFIPPIWRRASRVIAVSEFTRRLALQRYPVPIQVIPNGVDLAALPPRKTPTGDLLSKYPSGTMSPNLVFAGRFMEQKNPEHLVEALSRLCDLPWRCAMLGDGPLWEGVRRQVELAGLSQRIRLPGWVTPTQVLDEFSRSQVLILPSRSEGLSIVGLQALGMGLAMLLSDAGGNLELVQPGAFGNGFIFPTGDVDALTDRLKTLLQNPSMLQSAQAKSLELARRYDLPAIISQYESLCLSSTKGRAHVPV